MKPPSPPTPPQLPTPPPGTGWSIILMLGFLYLLVMGALAHLIRGGAP